MSRIWSAASTAVLDVLFPRHCVHCGVAGEWICAECASAVHVLTPPLCDSCGREIGAGRRCQPCAKEQPRIDGIRGATRYEHAIREAIHRLKYGGQRSLAEPLAGYLQLAGADFLPQIDLIAPVPLHPRRLRERGYNQALLLASELGRRCGLPVAELLERRRETRDQVGLNRAERQANLKGAFACSKPAAISGKRVLLVDDVCTTGSTLFACALALYQARAGAVQAVVVARQDRERE